MPTFIPAAVINGYGVGEVTPGDTIDPSLLPATTETDPVASAALATHAALGTSAHGGIVASSDPRLTDARTPVAHNQAWSTITGTPTTVAGYGITDAALAPIATLVVPTTGQTQTFTTTKAWQIIACNHTATIAAQTFVFPVDANAAIGQELRIFSRSIITTVTLTLNSNTILGTALTTLPAAGNVAWRKVAASTWARIQ